MSRLAGKTAIIISLIVGLAAAIFVSPLLGTLLEMGDFFWFFIFGILMPLAVALIFYLILRALGWGLSLFRT